MEGPKLVSNLTEITGTAIELNWLGQGIDNRLVKVKRYLQTCKEYDGEMRTCSGNEGVMLNGGSALGHA